MASLSVTNTLANGATILASEHNTNYSDIVTYVNNRNAGSATWDAISAASSITVPLVANNSTGTQDIFRAQDNGSNVFVVPDGGIITMASQSAARAYRNTSTQTVTSGNTTKVQMNGESYDVKSEFDSATNYRFTATKDGKYLVTASLNTTPAGTTLQVLLLYKNGAEYSRTSCDSSDVQTPMLTDIVSLAATDYLEVYLNAVSQDIVINNGENKSWFAIHKVS